MGEWSAGWADRCFRDAIRPVRPSRNKRRKQRVRARRLRVGFMQLSWALTLETMYQVHMMHPSLNVGLSRQAWLSLCMLQEH